MKRRFALKQLAIVAGATITLPAWATAWSEETLPKINTILSSTQETLLAEVAETFIPKTEIPGAKEVGVHKFINVMLTDCFPKEVQTKFSSILADIDKASLAKFKKSFTGVSVTQRLELLKSLEASKELDGFNDLKEAVINGYMNSEYIMKNVLKYELVPARFNGCFPVKSK